MHVQTSVILLFIANQLDDIKISFSSIPIKAYTEIQLYREFNRPDFHPSSLSDRQRQ